MAFPGDETVTQYPYRSAQVRMHVQTVPRAMMRAYEESLAAAAGVRMDNHVVYKVVGEYGPTMYVSCSDTSMTFGLDVVEKSW